MKKTIQLMLVLAIVLLATSACKTKQKITEIPAGAKKTAVAPKPVVTPTPAVNPAPFVEEAKVTEPEAEKVTTENFSLIDGEKDALKLKYHVVVGSYSEKRNAIGLQQKLIAEGKKALVVLNEQGKYRVLIASFNDYITSHKYRDEIIIRFVGAWVLVQK
ncbi:MAG: SPOR domain-containing protein [Paludibacter sp.]